MLVPEISLTPQTVDRFISRFGEDKIAVLHSKLSIGERYDQWNKIKKAYDETVKNKKYPRILYKTQGIVKKLLLDLIDSFFCYYNKL